MYAIIEDSGTQLKVSEGDTLTIDIRQMDNDATSVTFDRVLMVGGDGEPTVGEPYVSGATVEAEVLESMFLGKKIDVIKFKRRKGYRRKQGHRQRHMRVKVTSIKSA